MADVTATPIEKPEWQIEWEKRMAEFSVKTAATTEVIVNALANVVGIPSEDALALLSDPASATDEEIKAEMDILLKIPSAVFKKNVSLLRGPKPAINDSALVAPTETFGTGVAP